MTSFPAALTIPQTRNAHEQIEQLLDDIRKAKGLKPKYVAIGTESTKKIEDALEMVWDVDLQAQPLSAVASALSEKFDINVCISERGLEDAGVSVKDLVTVNVKGLKLQDALSLLLREYGEEVGWVVDEEAVWITSRGHIDSTLVTKVHDVRDLLDSGRVKNEENLEGAIMNSEAEFHDTWDESGGPGTLEHLPGLLIVGQTRDVHRWVERMLADLRALPPPPLAPPKEDKITLKVYRLDGMEAERMAEVVVKFVEPESWQAAGGEGTIEAVSGTRPGDVNPWVKEQPQPAPAAPAPSQTAPGLQPLKQFGGFGGMGGGQLRLERGFPTLPDGWLIVRQRESIHRKVAELLFDLRGLPTDSRRATVGTGE